MSRVAVTIDVQTYEVTISAEHGSGADYVAEVDGWRIPVHLPEDSSNYSFDWIMVDNRSY